MWSTMFGWPVVGVIVGILVGAGVSLLSTTPPVFQGARVTLTIAAVLFVGKVATWLVTVNSSTLSRWAATFAIFGAVGIGWVESWKWIERRESNWEAATSATQSVTESKKLEPLPPPHPPRLVPEPRAATRSEFLSTMPPSS
jgi:hypothetical protein